MSFSKSREMSASAPYGVLRVSVSKKWAASVKIMPCVSKFVNRVVGNPGSCGVIFFSHCPLVLDLCTAVSQYLEMAELWNSDYRKGGILNETMQPRTRRGHSFICQHFKVFFVFQIKLRINLKVNQPSPHTPPHPPHTHISFKSNANIQLPFLRLQKLTGFILVIIPGRMRHFVKIKQNKNPNQS